MGRTPTALLSLLASLALLAPGSARADEPSAPIATSDPRALHAISIYGRGVFVPDLLLGLGLQQTTTVQSGGLGASYTYRRGTFDLVTSLDLSFYSPGNGNFLAVGKEPSVDTHYAQFANLDLLSIDVGFYWVHDLTRHLAFVIGGGLGLGLLLGDVAVVNDQGAGCTAKTVGDLSQCHPIVNPSAYAMVGDPVPTYTDANGKQQPLSGALLPSDPDFQRKLDGLRTSQAACVAQKGGDCRDTAEHPYYHQAPEKPGVMVVLNFQLGFKIKVQRHLNVNVMGGFRDGFVVGGGPEYVF